MLKFEYSDIKSEESITCDDCKSKRGCKKRKVYKSIKFKERRFICYDFVNIPRGKQKVSDRLCDYNRFRKLVGLSLCHTNGILKHCHFETHEPIPSCEMFIKLLNVLHKHISDNKGVYVNYEEDLNDLIQTIIYVDENKVGIYVTGKKGSFPTDELLKKEFSNIIEGSGFEYEEIIDEEDIQDTEQKYI